MAPDPPTREEPAIDQETWDNAGRAAAATVPIETCRDTDTDPAQ